MSINKRPSVDAAFVASRVPNTTNLYVIGPYAARVSFASQQRRSLNLIWAINEDMQRSGDRMGLAGKDVAIIGGSLAGLTAAVAAAALGASVWGLEKQSSLMLDMKGARHRDIHPTINFWPQENLEVTTYLPFLNWFHDSCDKVLERIESEWVRLQKKHGGSLKGVWTQHELTSFNWRNDKWRIGFNASGKKQLSKKEFDVLIFATGFGAERFTLNSDTPRYWDSHRDCIFRIRAGDTDPCEHYIISGTGDGGLIEALRLLFKGFTAGSVEASTGPIFSDPKLPHLIKAIESDAQKRTLDIAIHEQFPLTNEKKDQISDLLWERYGGLVDDADIGLGISDALQATRSKIPKVILLGERSSPLELSASPYHKLLLAYALKNGYVEYFQLQAEALVEMATGAAGKFDVAEALDIKRKKVTFQALNCLRYDPVTNSVQSLPGGRFEFDNCLYMSRHGYLSPLPSLFGGYTVPDKIKVIQSLYADQDWLTFEQAEDFAEKLKEPQPSNPQKWMKAYLPMAREYFGKQYNLLVKGNDDDSKNVHYELQYISETANDDERPRYPTSFVGIRVDTDPAPAPFQSSFTGHSP